MEQKYYAASKGSWYLSVTNHPGELTEEDIVNNIQRMMELDIEEMGLPLPSWAELQNRAYAFYEENLDRIFDMVKLHENLEEVSKEDLEDTLSLPLRAWEVWELPRVEWD